MKIELRPVSTPAERRQFATFPWRIYRGDKNWVPPLLEGRLESLDPQKNPFWRTADQALWIAWRGSEPVGTICSIIDHHSIATTGEKIGTFGFFECVQDDEAACRLMEVACDQAAAKGMSHLRGPYNPSPTDESGILVEGFGTRPAILEAHTPVYYPAFFEGNGFYKQNDLLARLFRRTPGMRFEDGVPDKIRRVAERAMQRPDLVIRQIDLQSWPREVSLACQIYNAALGDLPGYVPVPDDEFARFAESFRPLVDRRFALVAELGGKPVGFALALPDINEALQKVNGRLNLVGLAKLWWFSRRLKRLSFKILMMLPGYQARGIEAVLVYRIAQEFWAQGYEEADLSLTGEENLKSTLFQANLGFKIYRRYRIYEKAL